MNAALIPLEIIATLTSSEITVAPTHLEMSAFRVSKNAYQAKAKIGVFRYFYAGEEKLF